MAGGTANWGYRYNYTGSSFGSSTSKETNIVTSSYNWAALPNSSTVIRQTNTFTDDGTTNNPDLTDVWIGASTILSQVIGLYTGTLVFSAVATE